MANREQMTSRERIAALYRRELTDRVPFMHKGYAFCAKHTGIDLSDIYRDPHKSFEAQKRIFETIGMDGGPFYTFIAYGAGEFGGTIRYPKTQASYGPEVGERPVLKPEDIEGLQLPEVRTAGCIPNSMEFARLQEAEDYEIAFICGTPFTHAANLCGVAEFLTYTKKYPELVHKALRLMTDHILEVAQYYVDTFGKGRVLARAVSPTESNALISPKTFEEFALPYVKELNSRVLEMGAKSIYIHMCGKQNKNLPKWAEVPFGDPGIISIGTEVSLREAAEFFPQHVIAGNLDPQIITRGTPQEVYEASRINILEGKELLRGRYIFMAGCEIPPNAPYENIVSMKRAVDDFGWYE
ncbi:hypothetical protein FRZ06_02285 [Anoxybacterium hadale]|uniref:Uncharacterized protein n=1 Tax=Anoxybacterium hadale TaxID=3408580 RepID=A0ACD1A755_9FIRM|nr:hypothetical protein FRZ06_02285 [Clostridiales bacterium]